MKIAILGTRGIPNNHGGFEQFAQHLSLYLVQKGHSVYIYNSNNHPFKEKKWHGVNIIHKFDPENLIGTTGQFIYDLNCIIHCRKSQYDIILQLGYTSSSIWGKLIPAKSILLTNMDGMEWKRSKYNGITRKFLKYAEMLAVTRSNYLISDSLGIQDYLMNRYNKISEYIPYGAHVFSKSNEQVLSNYRVEKYDFDLLIARLEPENNIETILNGLKHSAIKRTFLVIGKHNTKYGNYLKKKFKNISNIVFLGAIYNQNHLDNLRFYSNLYFHGHSVGGTNPSLLEAMASGALIIAHDNIFNKSILGNDAFYFNNSDQITSRLTLEKTNHSKMVENNISKITNKYQLDYINSLYENFMLKCLK